MKRYLILVMIFIFLALSCEKACDKIDGKRYDREIGEWVELEKNKDKK